MLHGRPLKLSVRTKAGVFHISFMLCMLLILLNMRGARRQLAGVWQHGYPVEADCNHHGCLRRDKAERAQTCTGVGSGGGYQHDLGRISHTLHMSCPSGQDVKCLTDLQAQFSDPVWNDITEGISVASATLQASFEPDEALQPYCRPIRGFLSAMVSCPQRRGRAWPQF